MSERKGAGPTRRDFLVLGAGAFTVSALGGLSWRERRLVRRTVPVMGTIAEVSVIGRDERRAHAAISAAMEELHAVHRTMSRFDATSDIGRANAAAYRQPVAVGAATATVIASALRWAAATGSVFDPCIGRVVELWDVARRSAPPAGSSLRRLAGRRLFRDVELARRGDADVVAFGSADVALDLGGIAKGYAVDRAVAALRAWGVTDGLVNVGGDLYALGAPLGHDAWQVGVRAPDSRDGIERVVPLTDAAIATSGDYEQYFDHDGTRYHHLMDPATAAPRRASAHSVTVAAADCMSADAAATAVFGLGADAARRVLGVAAPGARIA